MPDEDWKPVLEFADQSESFALGFEGGRIWQALSEKPDEQTFVIHGANAELMLRIAEAEGVERKLKWKETADPTWATVTFCRKDDE